MPKCSVCGEDEDNIYTCKKCGVKFCEYCGDAEEKLCLDCLEVESELAEVTFTNIDSDDSEY